MGIKHLNSIGKRLKEARLFRNISAESLARKLSHYKPISKQAISQYENGYSNPAPARLLHISTILELPVNYFTKDWGSADNHTPSQFRKLSSATKNHRERAELKAEWFLRLLYLIDKFKPFTEHNLIQSKVDFHSLSFSDIYELAQMLRKKWGMGVAPIRNLLETLESNGIIIAQFEIEEKLEGFSFWSYQKPVIILSNFEKNYFRSRLSAAHELGHLILHRNVSEEEIKNKEIHKKIEKQAYAFGAAFLMPEKSFGEEVMRYEKHYWLALKEKWRVSLAAMIMRANDLNKITDHQKQYYFRNNSNRRVEELDDKYEPETAASIKSNLEFLFANKIITPEALIDQLGLNTDILIELLSLNDDFFTKTI